MKSNKHLIVLLFSTLFSQTHILPETNAGMISFSHDRHVDFFGEEKFIRNSYKNSINLGYFYNQNIGFDLSIGSSNFDKKNEYTFLDGETFNFSKAFRSENEKLLEKDFIFGATYYWVGSEKNPLPLDLSIGAYFKNSTYENQALNDLGQDFFGKTFGIRLSVFKEYIDENIRIIPRITLNRLNEKNIYVLDPITNENTSFKNSYYHLELSMPIVFDQKKWNENTSTPFFIEPMIINKYGNTHLSISFGFLFD